VKGYSAAQLKKGKRCAIQQVPREGSKVRMMYDLFNKYKGHSIYLGADKNVDLRVRYLGDFYGLDIVHVGKGKWCMKGEWFGAKYVSYEVEKVLNVKIKQ
jgi:hypothetical protein